MKRIYFIFLLMIAACTSDELQPEPVILDTFAVTQNTVTDGSTITFTLEKEGTYLLTLSDGIQVVSREKFTGKIGKNVLRVYTRTIQTKYLYLVLQDSYDNQIGKTILIIK